MVDLKVLPDVELVKRVKESACSDSFNELSRRHSNLFYKICNNYIKTLVSFGCCAEDIFEEKDIILFESILKFNPEKGTLFSTWFGNYTRYFCLNKINKIKNMPEVSSEEEMAAVFEESSLKNFENRASITDLNTVLKTLESLNDQRIINLFKLRYDTNKRKRRTWSEIGKELRVSVQTAIQLHKKGLRLIRMEISDKKLDVFKDLAIF